MVYYKAHHLSKAHKKFHAGFAPKWWGPVRLARQVGKGVFLTNQQPPRKIHVSCFKRAALALIKHTHTNPVTPKHKFTTNQIPEYGNESPAATGTEGPTKRGSGPARPQLTVDTAGNRVTNRHNGRKGPAADGGTTPARPTTMGRISKRPRSSGQHRRSRQNHHNLTAAGADTSTGHQR